MKATTRKISGPAMERLFRRVIADSGVDGAVAYRLARQLALIVSSARVRRMPLRDLSRTRTEPASRAPAFESSGATALDAAVPTPQATSGPAARFDPYVFGLVPVFQREGRDGLLRRLSDIEQSDHLRAMAKAQQIALEPALRVAEASAADVRIGIVQAVEKRVADRRAAAS
jgi:hypothetical protein